jgi:hypothetical protein
MFVDLGENHELSFYHQGDLINIIGRIDGLSYTLNVSPHLPPAGHRKGNQQGVGSVTGHCYKIPTVEGLSAGG